MKKQNFFFRSLSKVFWSIATGVMAILLVGVIIGTHFATTIGAAAINMMFGTKNTVSINSDEVEPMYFYTSDYEGMEGGDKYLKSTADALFERDKKMVEEMETEGAVLLWNKSSALPLMGNEKVSALSHSSVDLVECGSGSGYVNTVSQSGQDASVTLKDALTSRGFSVNETLWNFYKSGAGKSYSRTNPGGACTEWRNNWVVNEVPWSVYTTAVKNSFATYKDVALVVISRTGGEYSDLHYNYTGANDFVGENDRGNRENTSAEGGYLGLSDQEEELLTHVTDGTFDKVVVLLNTPNPLQFQDFSAYYAGIDACMWIGQPGSSGINAVADLLKGKDLDGNVVTPSGRLADTFAYDNNSHPASVNDGNYRYSGDLSRLTQNNNRYNTYVVYQEGIYVGYRYFETRYADCVTGEGNANSTKGAKHSASAWNYSEEVAFPFGYGDSYTSFAYSNFNVTRNADGDFDVSVKVTNNGSVAGKEVVQVYLQKPYTQFDRTNKIEKSAIELVGYGKTSLLGVSKSEVVTITVKAENFKTYDANYHKTYIVEAGTYYLTVGNDAHNALNNVLSKAGKTPQAHTYFGNYSKTNNPTLGASFVQEINMVEDLTTYSKSTQTGVTITNQLDNGDINKYANRGSNSVVYLSRSDWDATYPTAAPTLTMNAQMAADLAPNKTPDATGIAMPKYNTFVSGSTTGTPDLNGGDRTAFEFIDAPLYPEKAKDQNETYNGKTYAEWTAMWEQLLDQMSFEEQSLMAANAYHQICGAESIGLPASKQENGPVGITKRGDFPVPDTQITEYKFVSYPCAGILAASYNDAVVEKMGQHKSEDMLFLGYNGIYGPGVNMHRTPFGGRAFEYPSEDPYLAGTIEYYESKGIENKGCLAYAKHFALNDTETNRRHVGVWSNEQATREIYLRAFELTFAEGGASATMNSFSRVGTKWNGACYEFMTTILRKEWGWDGINITDWMSGGPMSYVDAIMGGTDSFDGNGTTTSYAPWKNNAAVCQALRGAVRRIIYNVVKTNAMNGMSINTTVIEITPWWETALYSLISGFSVAFGASAIMTVLSFVFIKKEKVAEVEPSQTEGGAV